jgi:hypothetical protein
VRLPKYSFTFIVWIWRQVFVAPHFLRIFQQCIADQYSEARLGEGHVHALVTLTERTEGWLDLKASRDVADNSKIP